LLRHERALINYGGEAFVASIMHERAILIDKYASVPAFKAQIDDTKDGAFAACWIAMRLELPNLCYYCAGLACVMPATHAVESDFSVMKRTKDNTRRSLSNYALEGQLQSTQYKHITQAVASAAEVSALLKHRTSYVV